MVDSQFRGINSVKAAKLLENIATGHLLNNPNSILETENSIQAFGVYTIKKSSDRFKIYKNKVHILELYTAKNALAWCIADKYHVTYLTNNIHALDHQLNYKKININLLKTIMNKNIQSQQRWVIEDKLQDTLYKAKCIKNQLDKCINSAKYYQLKGFENETSRLGLKSPSREISKGI